MAEPEKVIYSIERCICHVPDACRDCAYDSGHPYNECVEMMLKDALTLLKAQEPGWISVKERLPDEDADVLVFNRLGIEVAAYTTNPTKRWYGMSGNTVYAQYWMPLPEPPKEG